MTKRSATKPTSDPSVNARSPFETTQGPVQHAVVGEGLAAALAVALLRHEGVLWVSGSGARLVPPLASLGASEGALLLERASTKLGIEGVTDPRRGCFVREFKNKSFQLPPWTQVPTDMRKDAEDELVWAPELAWVHTEETLRYGMTLPELDEQIRNRLASDPGVVRTAMPLRKVELGDRVRLTFAKEHGPSRKNSESSELVSVEVKSVIFADRLEELRSLDAKALLSLESVKSVRESKVSVLQWSAQHEPKLPETSDSVCVAPPREEKEALGRRIWGTITAGGAKSLWTMALSQEEFEDHNDIAKKIRKIRQSIEKLFAESLEGKSVQCVDEVVRVEQDLILDDPRELEGWDPVIWENGSARFVWIREAGGVERSLQQLARVGWSEAVSQDKLPAIESPPETGSSGSGEPGSR